MALQQGTTTSQPSLNAAAMAAAQAQSVASLHFPGEDGAPSLAEMAQRDLDAALQLLADRAVYITGSTGAAIALRRTGRNDMLCRASTGSNAPELGALLSTEVGLSGESVRTRRTLRCDDAEQDARVNREVCREMGIASVVVMPVVNDDQVLGVFELFSGKVNAFGERDLSALQRLSEMVETAVKLAEAAETIPAVLAAVQAAPALPAQTAAERHFSDTHFSGTSLSDQKIQAASAALPAKAWPAVTTPTFPVPAAGLGSPVAPTSPSNPAPAAAPSKKPLFWSAASSSIAPANSENGEQGADQSHVPPVLRTLRKCEACGFPVTAGRALCVECEEKKWRGQLRRSTPLPAQPNPGVTQAVSTKGESAQELSVPVARLQAAAKSGAASAAAPAPAPARAPELTQGAFVADYPMTPVKPASAEVFAAAPLTAPTISKTASVAPTTPATSAAVSKPAASTASPSLRVAPPELILSAASGPSQSWFSANKYILGALVLVAATIATILLLR